MAVGGFGFTRPTRVARQQVPGRGAGTEAQDRGRRERDRVARSDPAQRRDFRGQAVGMGAGWRSERGAEIGLQGRGRGGRALGVGRWQRNHRGSLLGRGPDSHAPEEQAARAACGRVAVEVGRVRARRAIGGGKRGNGERATLSRRSRGWRRMRRAHGERDDDRAARVVQHTDPTATCGAAIRTAIPPHSMQRRSTCVSRRSAGTVARASG